MTSKINEIFRLEIDKIINNNNTISVFLVGSSKNIDFNLPNIQINDIDIFVFVNQGENQVRVIKEVEGIEFDINYFSRNGFKNLIKNKEYFFLKEMKNAKVIYDKHNTASHIITLCKNTYLEGPQIISDNNKYLLKSEIESKISRLEKKDKFEKFEYEFLTNIYLKDIIVGYFSINNKWIPKDKKLLKELKEEDKELFNLVKLVQENYKYENLLNIYNYVFKNIDIRRSIKITY